MPDKTEIDKYVEEVSSATQEVQKYPFPSFVRVATRYPLARILREIRLNGRLRKQWQVIRDHALRAQDGKSSGTML
jgi:hypothetical protein